jgi:cell division protein FtsW
MTIAVFFLSLIGIIYSFETEGNLRSFGEHIMFVGAGFLVMFVLSKYRYVSLKKVSMIIMFIALVLLVLVLLPGIGMKINGARRWINLGITSFQPTEFVKLAVIIFLAHWFENIEKNRNIAFFLLIGIIFFLIMLEPDMGTGMIVSFISFSMFLISKTTNLIKVIAFFPIILLILFVFIKSSGYRSSRVSTFFNSDSEKLGSSYHVNQALISVGSGGIFGVGIGKSKQKYSYLPENSTDSIFGIIAEETGFVGSSFMIFCYFIIFLKGFNIAFKCKNAFGKFLGFGITIFITIQAFLNFSSMLSLLPLTGVPLPFISSGGSALLAQFAAIGILLNIKNVSKSSKFN